MSSWEQLQQGEREKDAVMKTFHHRLGPLTCFARLKQLSGSARAASQQPRGAGGRAGPGSGYRHLSQRRHPSRGEGDRGQPQPGARWHQRQGERVLTPRSGQSAAVCCRQGGAVLVCASFGDTGGVLGLVPAPPSPGVIFTLSQVKLWRGRGTGDAIISRDINPRGGCWDDAATPDPALGPGMLRALLPAPVRGVGWEEMGFPCLQHRVWPLSRGSSAPLAAPQLLTGLGKEVSRSGGARRRRGGSGSGI